MLLRYCVYSDVPHRKAAGRHIWEAETRGSLLASSSMFFKHYLSPNVLNHWDRPVIQKITFQRSAEEKTDTAVSQFDLVHCHSTLSFHRVYPRRRTPRCSQTPDETDHWRCRHYYWLLKLSLTEKKKKPFLFPTLSQESQLSCVRTVCFDITVGTADCLVYHLWSEAWRRLPAPSWEALLSEWWLCVSVWVCVSENIHVCVCEEDALWREEVFCMYERAQLCVSSLKLRVCVCESTCMYIKKTKF